MEATFSFGRSSQAETDTASNIATDLNGSIIRLPCCFDRSLEEVEPVILAPALHLCNGWAASLGKQHIRAQDRTVQRASLIVRSIWAACLVIGGANHARTLLQHGLFWDYGGVAWPSAVYWSSLTIIDPIAAALLFARPKLGIVSTVVIIVTNVIHNLAVTARYAPDGEFLARASNPFIISQIGFMLFVGATVRIAGKCVNSSRDSARGEAA